MSDYISTPELRNTVATVVWTDWEESIWQVSAMILKEWSNKMKRECFEGQSNKMWLIL